MEPTTSDSTSPAPPQKVFNPFEHLSTIVSGIAVLSGIAIALGMLGNTFLLFSGGAAIFATALTIEDHISAAASSLPLAAISILGGALLRLLDKDAPAIVMESGSRAKRRMPLDWRLIAFCVVCAIGVFTAPIPGIPLPIFALITIAWGYLSVLIASRFGFANRLNIRLLFSAGFLVNIVLVFSLSDGLNARWLESQSQVTLEDGRIEMGNVLFVGSRGTILTNRELEPRFVAAGKIVEIKIVSKKTTRVPSILCLITRYACYEFAATQADK